MENSLIKAAQEVLNRVADGQREIERLGLAQQSSTSEGVNARTFPMFCVDIEDLESFEIGWTLLLQSQRKDQQRQLFESLISHKERYIIEPNRRYTLKDYTEIFNNKLELFELAFQVGDLPVMEQTANEVLGMTEVHPQDDAQARLGKLAQRVEALWRIAPDTGISSLITEAHASVDELITLCADVAPSMLTSILEMLASKYLTLAENGLERIASLNKARKLLENVYQRQGLSESGAEILARVCCAQEDYAIARQALDSLNMRSPELYRLWLLSSLENASAFRQRFGPFAASIYAECKNIYLAEAWEEVEGERIPLLGSNAQKAGGILIGNVVVYETSNQPGAGSQSDIMMHETIHVGVRDRQMFKSEGVWLPAKRDVPTAALSTYTMYLKQSKDEGLDLPESLEFFAHYGRMAGKRDKDTIADKIRSMLEYFDAIREESNACYICAAILAGVIEVLFEDDSERVASYVSHLEVFDHDDAVDKARRLVPLLL